MDSIAHFWERLALTPPLARDDLHLVVVGCAGVAAAEIDFANASGAMLYVPKAHRADVLALSPEAVTALCGYLETWWANSQGKKSSTADNSAIPTLPINYITG
ncbi:MAG: hypothetical protein ACP5VQ_06610, partial [Phycisphaerae bacterium]